MFKVYLYYKVNWELKKLLSSPKVYIINLIHNSLPSPKSFLNVKLNENVKNISNLVELKMAGGII